jgi:hypothetical protein
MKKIILVIAVTMVLVSVLGVYYLYVSSKGSSIIGPSSGYLMEVPSSLETKIYLVSADNPHYGVYNWSDHGWMGGEVHEGDLCFIVNVTVRNDYTDPLWTDEDSPWYNNHVKLTAYLYNNTGRVGAVDVTYPINSLHGGHVFVVEPEEIRSVELYMVTENKDVKRYEIYVAYIGPMMEP